MADLEWAEDAEYSGGGDTKTEPGAGIKAKGQLTTTANVSAQELNYQIHELCSRQNDRILRDIPNAMRLVTLAPGITQVGCAVFEAAGYYIAVASGGAYRAIALCNPGDSTSLMSGTLTGTPTFTGDVPAAVSDSYAIFTYGAYAYVFDTSMGNANRFTLASITTAADICFSEYSGKFFVCGITGASNGAICESTTGASWALVSGATSTNNGYSMISCDVTGQYILAAPNIGDDWAYSDDGGATWSVITKAINGDTSFTPTDLCYDDHNSQWLVTLDSASHALPEYVWYSTDPTVGWNAAPICPDIGLRGESAAAACGVIALGEYWLVGVGSTTYFNIVSTRDQGTTWTRGFGNPDNAFHESTAPLRFLQHGRYVFLTDDGVPAYLSGAI